MNSQNRFYLDGAADTLNQRLHSFETLGLLLNDRSLADVESDFPTEKFHLIHHGTGRLLYIHFSVKSSRNLVVFTSYIAQPDGKNFALKDWLVKHPEVNVTLEDDSRKPDEFLSCFDQYIDSVYLLVSTVLSPYLNTDRWEQVPIDLSPYK